MTIGAWSVEEEGLIVQGLCFTSQQWDTYRELMSLSQEDQVDSFNNFNFYFCWRIIKVNIYVHCECNVQVLCPPSFFLNRCS